MAKKKVNALNKFPKPASSVMRAVTISRPDYFCLPTTRPECGCGGSPESLVQARYTSLARSLLTELGSARS